MLQTSVTAQPIAVTSPGSVMTAPPTPEYEGQEKMDEIAGLEWMEQKTAKIAFLVMIGFITLTLIIFIAKFYTAFVKWRAPPVRRR